MLKNYFTTAWRNLLNNKVYSVINILGLALGFASSLIIFFIVRNELNYDGFHKKADRIYRVTWNAIDFNSNISLAVAPALRNDFPELENVTQTLHFTDGLISVGDKKLKEKNIVFADDEFFKVFTYQWIAGNPSKALIEPNAVVLTEAVANKYFNKQNAIGKVIKINNQYSYKVTGIIKDVPVNTNLPLNMIASWASIKKGYQENLSNIHNISGGVFTYLVLPENLPLARIQRQMKPFLKKNWGEEVAKKANLPLQPLTDIHFDRRYINNIITPTGKETSYALAAVAIFILISACINFINLATAQAVKRSKEVGVRKVLGAGRFQLTMQFLTETSIMVLTSVLLAIFSIIMILPLLNQYLDSKIGLIEFTNFNIITVITVTTMVMIVTAGLYASYVQASFQPAKALKNKFQTVSWNRLKLRKVLVVIQFVISQVLIIGTLVVAHQMDFFTNKDLGFDKESIISIDIPDERKSKLIQSQLEKIPGIEGMSLSTAAPAYNNNFVGFFTKESGVEKEDVSEIKLVDENYLNFFNIKLLDGEGITKSSARDTNMQFVVNETLARKIGYRNLADAIGERVNLGGKTFAIKGVVKDFQSESKHKPIRACILAYYPEEFDLISIKINSSNFSKTIAAIDKIWSNSFPERIFEYEFLDHRIALFYKQEENMYKAFQLFSGIAIFIGCLGLYGLISFVTTQRVKEIGIRKVLGAGTFNILNLFLKEYLLLIFVSFLIAAPIAYYAMGNWLQNFAYHITISWVVFIAAIVISVLVGFVAVGYNSLKAALASPVKSLRTE